MRACGRRLVFIIGTSVGNCGAIEYTSSNYTPSSFSLSRLLLIAIHYRYPFNLGSKPRTQLFSAAKLVHQSFAMFRMNLYDLVACYFDDFLRLLVTGLFPTLLNKVLLFAPYIF